MASKIVAIGKFYKIPFGEWALKMYLNDKLCAKEISDKILKESGIAITHRSIQRYLKSWGAIRPLSEAFNLAINRGRKSYKHLTKPIKSSELRKGISLGARYKVFQRDGSRCVLCGKNAKKAILTIDHIISVVNGGTNNLSNLQTLCRECNHGKMIREKHEKQ